MAGSEATPRGSAEPWRAADLARLTGGQAGADFAASGVSVDVHHLRPGDLFVAFDAGQARAALGRGAAGVIAARMPPGCAAADPVVVVADLRDALLAIARAARARLRGPVVAVAGALGKSTALSMLGVMLGRGAAEEPGEGGRAPEAVDAARRAGLALALAHLAPRIGAAPLLVEYDPAPGEPLEGLHDLLAPDALFLTPGPGTAATLLSAPPAILVLPETLRAELPEPARSGATGYGTGESAQARLLRSRVIEDTAVMETRAAGGLDVLLRLRHPAAQIGLLALGAHAMAVRLGADPALAAIDLGAWEPPAGQGARERIYLDIVDAAAAFDLFDVAFEGNESLAALAADLATLAAARPRDGVGRMRRGRRIAFIGSRHALPSALAAAPVMQRIDRVHCFGAGAAALHAALPPTLRGEMALRAEDLAERVPHLIDAGDVAMVRGSPGSGAGRMVDALRKMGQPGAAEAHGAQRGLA